MSYFNLGKIRNWKRRAWKSRSDHDGRHPLREFVYLDEVSLRSLLSSQKGEVTETISGQTVNALDAELSGGLRVGVPLAGGAGLASKFQTSNSSTLQTSRKATVQSWFREFHSLPGLRLIEVVAGVPEISSIADIKEDQTMAAIESSKLVRGSLIELRVKLATDPVFHLVSIFSEFVEMGSDIPNIDANVLKAVREAQPIHRILDRLLAGLIPIRAEAVDYVVVEIEDEEYIVRREAAGKLDLQARPLTIVAVTEHIAYWKDIRRVLFSGAEFTVLCRISRSGLQSTWTPVKLADLFREVVPDFGEQIDLVGRSVFANARAGSTPEPEQNRLVAALLMYEVGLLETCGKTLSTEQQMSILKEIGEIQPAATSAVAQRNAFAVVKAAISKFVDLEIDPTRDLELRNAARDSSGLLYLPMLAPRETTSFEVADVTVGVDPSLLDVEVVAIYW